MRHLNPKTVVVLVAFCVATLVGSADAQQAQDPAQTAAALARAQGLLRQIGQQKAQLEIENAKSKVEIASLKKKLQRAESTLKNTTADLASSERQNQRTEASLERTKARLEKVTERLKEFVEKYKTTSQTLAVTEQQRAELEAMLAATRTELADAEEKNLALYKTNLELLDKYKNKSKWEAMLQKEPFTGIKQVEVESFIENQEYDMFDQLRDANLAAARQIGQERRRRER